MRPIVSYRLTACVDSTPYINSSAITTDFTSPQDWPGIAKQPTHGPVRAFVVRRFTEPLSDPCKKLGDRAPSLYRPQTQPAARVRRFACQIPG